MFHRMESEKLTHVLGSLDGHPTSYRDTKDHSAKIVTMEFPTYKWEVELRNSLCEFVKKPRYVLLIGKTPKVFYLFLAKGYDCLLVEIVLNYFHLLT